MNLSPWQYVKSKEKDWIDGISILSDDSRTARQFRVQDTFRVKSRKVNPITLRWSVTIEFVRVAAFAASPE